MTIAHRRRDDVRDEVADDAGGEDGEDAVCRRADDGGRERSPLLAGAGGGHAHR
ncbi:hypothetical protein [Dermacoccus sp. SAI-028]|uniref:hypothetical protein n=1 Tax=Dermacoccus sp. SAI-028 TaxID=2768432 RepID=UPI0013579740|nr:hypothetical protein [Dermacoccus sp. SAI-028]